MIDAEAEMDAEIELDEYDGNNIEQTILDGNLLHVKENIPFANL